ncbi:MAG TPA: hypothetical protein VNL38_01330, partial [Candidatus Nitrosotenuis sp.]|nr:hypothetical protein [Candidatus Nitrosotenuis sp.]
EELHKSGLQFQAQMAPIIEAWKEESQAAQREWMATMDQRSEESIEKYRERLENVSSTWILAAVTNLGQHSRELLNSLVQTSEEQLRQTCAQVLADLGSKLSGQLTHISEELKSRPKTSGDKPVLPES